MIELDHKGTFRGAPLGRRSLMKRAGTGAAGTVALGAAGFGGAVATSRPAAAVTGTPNPTADNNVLNFALNLEYLEAEFYLRAVTGQGLPSSLTGNSTSSVTAPSTTLVPFNIPALYYYAQRIAADEYAHVTVLREVLGSAAINAPAIDFVESFTTLAVAGGLIAQGQTFNPFQDEIAFLVGAYIFEDVGVTAYAGAGNALTVPANLSYAASILAIEGYHAGAIRGYLATAGGGAATNAVSALRAKLSGVADNGTDVTGNPYNFNNVDINGQVYRRTPQQVLNIVYGQAGTGVTKGLFFPNGVNGAITST